VPDLSDYHLLLSQLEEELDRIGRTACQAGCSDCCRPLTVLPLEAAAIVDARGQSLGADGPARSGGERCPLLTSDLSCGIYPARPFVCRIRGFPIAYLNDEGAWARDICAFSGFESGQATPQGLRMDIWNARLFRLNEAFCARNGLDARRLSLSRVLAPQRAAGPTVGR
jgi:uncharacterized protein